jgi:hypothetical protein
MKCQYCLNTVFSKASILRYSRCQKCAALIRKKKVQINYKESYQNALLQAASLKIKNLESMQSELGISFHGKHIFDYGCGTGSIVKHLNCEPGAIVGGYDPFSQLKEYNTLRVNKWPIDFLLLFDVIEHFDSLEQIEIFIKNFLKKGSCIIITTPNSQSAWLRFLGPFWPHLNGEHLSIASIDSLKKWSVRLGGHLEYAKPFSKHQVLIHFYNTFFKTDYPVRVNRCFKLNTGEILAKILI